MWQVILLIQFTVFGLVAFFNAELQIKVNLWLLQSETWRRRGNVEELLRVSRWWAGSTLLWALLALAVLSRIPSLKGQPVWVIGAVACLYVAFCVLTFASNSLRRGYAEIADEIPRSAIDATLRAAGSAPPAAPHAPN